MKTVINILIVLTVFSTFIFGCKKGKPQKIDRDVSMDFADIKKDPNVYYNGCVSCVLTLEKRGLLKNNIFMKVQYRNNTGYPIPVENRHMFVSMKNEPNVMEWSAFEVQREGEEVSYRGVSIDRMPSEFPHDYYILPPSGEYTAVIKLNKYYDISRNGKYSIKYLAFNALNNILEEPHYYVIESDTLEFEKK